MPKTKPRGCVASASPRQAEAASERFLQLRGTAEGDEAAAEEEIVPTKAPKRPYTHRMFVQRGPRTDEALSIDRRDDRILAERKT